MTVRLLQHAKTVEARSFLRSPIFPVALAAFLLLAPVWATGKALFWGTPLLQFTPWRYLAWEMLAAGRLPLWNPLSGMGAPLLANFQTAFLYPPNWLYFLLMALDGLPAMAWGQAVVVAFHLAWAGAGMALLARRLSFHWLGQAVAGLAFALSGYLVARAGFLSINAAAAWTPWVVLAAHQVLAAGWENASSPGSGLKRFFEGEYLRPVLFLAFCFGMQLLAGHAQTTWYTGLLAAGWAVYWTFRFRSNGRGRWGRAWLGLAVAAGLAVCLALVQLLPTFEYLAQSQRNTAVDFDYAMTYSFWPWHLLTLINPEMFGNPARGDYWGYANYWEDALYAGLLPLLLAVSAVFRRMRAPNGRGCAPADARADVHRGVRGFALLLLPVTLLLALGSNTPLFPWLFRHVPTFSMFQAPSRYLIWFEFSLALLAALGAEYWRRPEKRALYWTRLGLMGAVAVTLGAGLAWVLMGDIRPTFIRGTALAGVFALGSGALSLLAPPRDRTASRRAWWPGAVTAFVALDLLVAGWGLNPAVPVDFYSQAAAEARAVKEMSAGGRHFLLPEDERELMYDRFFRFDTFTPEGSWDDLLPVMLPNLNLFGGPASANNYDPLVPGRYRRWMDAFADLDEAGREAWLNLMGIQLVEQVQVDGQNGVAYTPPPGGQPLPRARWVPCGVPALDPEDALEQVASLDSAKLQEIVVLEGETRPVCSPSGDTRVTWDRLPDSDPTRLVINVQAESAGYLVLSDTWYPDWQAQVDGRSVPVLPANSLFRAVEIPPGEHQVTFVYRPTSFWTGLWVSLAAWCGLLLAYRKARPR